MFTRYKTATQNEVISTWWKHIAERLGLFLDLMSDGAVINDSEIHAALKYMQKRRRQLEEANHPPIVEHIISELIAAVTNMEQSLNYRIEGNHYQGQLRMDMAKANMDAVRFRLLEYGIFS